MSRKPRVEFEGAFYHVIARGNQRQELPIINFSASQLIADQRGENSQKRGLEAGTKRPDSEKKGKWGQVTSFFNFSYERLCS